jgi:hypothetical protein
MPPDDAGPLWLLATAQIDGQAGQRACRCSLVDRESAPGPSPSIEACCPREGFCQTKYFSSRLKKQESLGRKSLKELSKTQKTEEKPNGNPRKPGFETGNPSAPENRESCYY